MKKYIITTVILLYLAMTGCSVDKVIHQPTEEEIQESIEADVQASIEQDKDYQQYHQLKAEGKTTENGIYLDSELEAEKEANAVNDGKIHVTFAVNSHLDVQYFYDAELTQPITSECWLKPGASIYASLPETKHDEIAAYEFDAYRISEYNIMGERVKSYSANYSEKNLVYQLPDDDSVKELSIEPLGKYTKRKYRVKASFENGSTTITGGQWFVNDQPFVGNIFEVEPSLDCNVKYTFPEDDYYCIEAKCSPKPQAVNEGSVVFEKITASNTEVNAFTVILGKKIHATVELQDQNSAYSMRVNGKSVSLQDQYAFNPKDVVTITIPRSDMIQCDLSEDSIQTTNSQITYTFTIPEAADPGSTIDFVIKKNEPKKIEVVTSGWALLNAFKQNEADLVHVKAGETIDFNFNELKAIITPKTIEPYASDELKIRINEAIRNNPNFWFRIKLNGENDLYFSKYSDQLSLRRACDTLDKVEIYLEDGYVFEEDIIQDSNQELKTNIKYYYEDGNEVKKGALLKPGTKIRIVAENVPNGYTISGGAIKKGQTEGTIKISNKTKASDFVVNYEKM